MHISSGFSFVWESLQFMNLLRRVFLTDIDLKNNRVLTYEGCFGFHRVVNAKESRPNETA